MRKRVGNKGIKCAICNGSSELLNGLFSDYNKVCLSCYFNFTNDTKIPEHIPIEQHDLWIIKNNERNSK